MSDSASGGGSATLVRTEGGGIVFEVPRNEDVADVLFVF
jgi:hypothetical protein